MKHQELLQNAAEVWCPNYPRRVAGLVGNDWGQLTAHQPEELVHHLQEVQGTYPGYVSTYSFPNGHPTNDRNNVPRIDTLMIDFDIEMEDFSKLEWATNMKKLLNRLNRVAHTILDEGKGEYFRWSLSGYKGVHLYLDFPEIPNGIGTPNQFEDGMAEYMDNVVNSLISLSGVEDLRDFIDVSSGWDLSRLTRLPNTVHEKATKQFDKTKYCVPVTTEEMAQISTEHYLKMTRNPRQVPSGATRTERTQAADKAKVYIKTTELESSGKGHYDSAVVNDGSYTEYKEELVNKDLTLKDVKFFLKRKPCIWSFRTEGRMFADGTASHQMEMQCILAMASIGTPIVVMHKFFSADPAYSYEETQTRIKKVLARDYNELDCATILEEAEQFCLKERCKLYNDDEELQKIS